MVVMWCVHMQTMIMYAGNVNDLLGNDYDCVARSVATDVMPTLERGVMLVMIVNHRVMYAIMMVMG